VPTKKHGIFRVAWWSANLLLAVAVGSLIYSGDLEYSLERKSFFALVVSAALAFLLLVLRFLLAWYADCRVRIPRFHLREHFLRASAAFFGTPGIK
jgi:hypothetical protein